MDLHSQFRTLSLCSGIGGLDLGLRLAVPGARTVCYVEREAYCCAVLVSRIQDKALDDTPIFSDVAAFDGRPWRGRVDCVTGGYPCQPFSVAGQRRGADDPRHLWPHIRRIVAEVEPEWCFFENVANHLNLGFAEVAGDLSAMGYRVAAGLFTAAEVGASHKRARLFILAHAEEQPEREPHDSPRPHTRGHARENAGRLGGAVGVAHRPGLEGRQQPLRESAHERPVGEAGLPLFPPGPDANWTGMPAGLYPALPAVRGVADGLSPRVDRLRSLGNGVVPLVAAHAFRSLLADLCGA